MSITFHPNLPLEIILRILDSLAPTTAVALHPSDPSAQCIRTFTLVCRGTYPLALRLLYRYCLYVHGAECLRQLLVALEVHTSRAKPLTRTTTWEDDETNPSSPSASTSSLPRVDILPCLQNLFLDPYSLGSIDDLPTAHWIFELFSITRHTLRRLVTRIPFRSVQPEEDHLNVRPRIVAAFKELTQIEEYVSIDDIFYQGKDGHDVPVWNTWTKLRRLAVPSSQFAPSKVTRLRELANLTDCATFSLPGFWGSEDFWPAFFHDSTGHGSRDVNLTYHTFDFNFQSVVRSGDDPCLPRGPNGSYRNHRHMALIKQAQEHNQRHARKMLDGAIRGEVNLNLVALCRSENLGLLDLIEWIMGCGAKGTLFDVDGHPDLTRHSLDPNLWITDGIYVDDGNTGKKDRPNENN